jgi:hypothetical protein
MQKAVRFGRIVSGQLPIEAIEDMASLNSLNFARPAYAKTNVGSVTSQCDEAMRSATILEPHSWWTGLESWWVLCPTA